MKTLKMIITIAVAACIATFQLSSAQGLGNEEYSFQLKSASKASLYSFLATAVPVTVGTLSAFDKDLGTDELILISSGLIVGPSVGYIYAGMNEHGTKGIVYRSVFGAGAVLLGNSMGLEIAIFGGEADDEGWPLAIFGTAFLIGHAVIDLARVNSLVNKHNYEKYLYNETSVFLYPKYFADSGAGGLELNIRF